MKIGSFIWGIITFVLAVLLSGICYKVYGSIQETSGGVEALSLIVTIPLLIILYIALVGLLLSAVINTVRAIFSDAKAIKIISIIFLVLEICVTAFDAFVAVNILG